MERFDCYGQFVPLQHGNDTGSDRTDRVLSKELVLERPRVSRSASASDLPNINDIPAIDIGEFTEWPKRSNVPKPREFLPGELRPIHSAPTLGFSQIDEFRGDWNTSVVNAQRTNRKPLTANADCRDGWVTHGFVVSPMGIAGKPLLTQSHDPAIAKAAREEMLAVRRQNRDKRLPWQFAAKALRLSTNSRTLVDSQPSTVERAWLMQTPKKMGGLGRCSSRSSDSTCSTRTGSSRSAKEPGKTSPWKNVSAGVRSGGWVGRMGFPPGLRFDTAPGFGLLSRRVQSRYLDR